MSGTSASKLQASGPMPQTRPVESENPSFWLTLSRSRDVDGSSSGQKHQGRESARGSSSGQRVPARSQMKKVSALLNERLKHPGANFLGSPTTQQQRFRTVNAAGFWLLSSQAIIDGPQRSIRSLQDTFTASDGGFDWFALTQDDHGSSR